MDLLQIEKSRSFRIRLAARREYPKIAIPNFGLLERSANRRTSDRGFRASFFGLPAGVEEEEALSSVRSWLVSYGQLFSLFVARPRTGRVI